MIVQCLLLLYLTIYSSIAVLIEINFSESTVVIDEGDSLRILCPYLDNCQFFYPNNSSSIVTSTIKIKQSINLSSGNTMSIFERFRTIYRDTGWYGFSISNSEFSNLNVPKSYRVYVYIKSQKNLFVNQKDSLSFLLGETSDAVTIPCRPTGPNYTVELFHNGNLFPNSDRIQFDPKKGFYIRSLTIRDIGEYTCKINHFNYEEEVSFFLQITSKIKKINQPVISILNQRNFIIKGQELQLNCSVEIESDSLYNLSWLKPNKNESKNTVEKYFVNSLGKNFYQKVKQLTVRNISGEDEGNYICCIESGSTKKCTSISVTVEDENFEFLNITSKGIDFHYSKKCNESISWIVEYNAYPLPTVHWLHPNHRIIHSHGNNNYFMKQGYQRVILNIKVLSKLDTGIHKLIITNRAQTVEIHLDLKVDCDHHETIELL